MKEKILRKLQELTGHKLVVLTPRGNASIKAALEIAKSTGKTKVLIPNQGGWITYKQYPDELGMELVEVKTNDALISIEDVKKNVDSDSVLLYENPGGYFVEEPMKQLFDICKEKGAMVILDVSGGIGTDMCDGRYADIMIGSFGRWKPVNVEYGGFISTNKNFDVPEFDIDESKLPAILEKLKQLPERISFLNEKRKKVIEDLKAYNIVHPQSKGYVVIVKGDDVQLEEVKEYCRKNDLEWTDCPRYIRILDKAVSIEVKRL